AGGEEKRERKKERDRNKPGLAWQSFHPFSLSLSFSLVFSTLVDEWINRAGSSIKVMAVGWRPGQAGRDPGLGQQPQRTAHRQAHDVGKAIVKLRAVHRLKAGKLNGIGPGLIQRVAGGHIG